MKRHGPWQINKSHDIYRDPWISVRKDDVIRPDGKPGTYSVVNLKPGVCVLAMDDERNVFLTEEFHYGVGRTTVEAVSGGIEKSESALNTAKRELKEELGIEADHWTDLGVVDPFTANVVSPTSMFLARGLHFGNQQLEGTELIQCVQIGFDEAVAKVLASTISHAPTCVVILKVHLMAEKLA